MIRSLLLLVCSALALKSCGQDPKTPKKHQPVNIVDSIQLGNRYIRIHQTQYGDSGLVMVNMHDDESTSVEAARILLSETGGKLIRIENNGQRLIPFVVNGKEVRFDANRMFTKEGLVANLKKLNTIADPVAVMNITKLRDYFLSLIDPNTKLLVALHNNDEGNLTINSYRPGGNYVKDAKKVNVEPGIDPDNFFLTTDKDLFEELTKQKQNVVLQDNENASDDGSMSIYYGRRGMKYVNVEAQLGDIDSQLKMLRLLFRNSKYYKKGQ